MPLAFICISMNLMVGDLPVASLQIRPTDDGMRSGAEADGARFAALKWSFRQWVIAHGNKVQPAETATPMPGGAARHRAQRRNAEMVADMLTRRLGPGALDGALIDAADGRLTAIVQTLLNKGADVNACLRDSRTALTANPTGRRSGVEADSDAWATARDCFRACGRNRPRSWPRPCSGPLRRPRLPLPPVSTTLPPLAPLERNTLWDSAYAALRTALMEGRLAPGQRIVLRDVAERLGISLTPVRDAVNRLIAERVLERGVVGQGGGATVPLLDADQFRQLMAVRACLEPGATVAAAPNVTPAALAEIEQALREMETTFDEKRPDAYLQAHHRFHFGIYALCRMPIMLEIIEMAWVRCAPTLTLGLPEYVPGLKRFPLHVACVEALRRGDGERAAAAIRADIDSAREDIVPLLERAHRS